MTGVNAARLRFWRKRPTRGPASDAKGASTADLPSVGGAVDGLSDHRLKNTSPRHVHRGIDAGWVPHWVSLPGSRTRVQCLCSAVFENGELRFSAFIRSRYRFEWSFVDPSCGRHRPDRGHGSVAARRGERPRVADGRADRYRAESRGCTMHHCLLPSWIGSACRVTTTAVDALDEDGRLLGCAGRPDSADRRHGRCHDGSGGYRHRPGRGARLASGLGGLSVVRPQCRFGLIVGGSVGCRPTGSQP
jgi:hypothetical protein